MARLSTVVADYFRSRLVGFSIRATRSPKFTTTTHRLTRRFSVEVPQGALGMSVGSHEGLRQVSGLLGGLWVMFFDPHPQLCSRNCHGLHGLPTTLAAKDSAVQRVSRPETQRLSHPESQRLVQKLRDSAIQSLSCQHHSLHPYSQRPRLKSPPTLWEKCTLTFTDNI